MPSFIDQLNQEAAAAASSHNHASTTGQPSGPIEFVPYWHTEVELWGGLLFALVAFFAFMRGKRVAWGGPARPQRKREAWFVAGVTAFYLSVASPLDELGEQYLFSMHMLQHMLIIFVVSPMLIVGLPEWLLNKLFGHRYVKPLVRFITYPVVTWLVFNLIFAGWHYPPLYEWALRDRHIHNLEHLMFLTAGLLMWFPLINPMPNSIVGTRTYGGAMIYLFALSVGQMPMFAYIGFASAIRYPSYEFAPRLIGLNMSPATDQLMGSVIMKVAAMGTYLIVLGYFFYRWVQSSETSAADGSRDWQSLAKSSSATTAASSKPVVAAD